MRSNTNPEEMAPEVQNRGTSGPKIGHFYVSDKKKKKKKEKKVVTQTLHGLNANVLLQQGSVHLVALSACCLSGDNSIYVFQVFGG